MTDPNSTTKKPPGKSAAKTDDAVLLIDYRGTVGAAPGQSEIAHVRSPLYAALPRKGVTGLTLHPGLNLIPRSLWTAYFDAKAAEQVTDERDREAVMCRAIHEQVVGLVNDGHIRVLEALPSAHNDLTDLIDRTYDHEPLRAIEQHVTKMTVSTEDGFAYERSTRRIEALKTKIARRLATTRPVANFNRPYMAPRPVMPRSQAHA